MFHFDASAARGAVAAWVVASALSSAAHAAPPERHDADHGHAHPAQELTAKDFRNAPRDLVLWGELAKVGVTRKSGRYHVTFLPPVLALDGKTVTLVGFMTNVHPGERHTQFLLSDRPICEECHYAPNPSGIVEVNAKLGEPVRRSPILVRGRLELVKDDPHGLIYRLRDAKVIRRH